MVVFKIGNLPTEVKNIHESQNKWRGKNWKETLKKHSQDIEKLLKKINLFDIWSNKLQTIPATKALIREIFMDAFISIHFAGYALYKYANMCLRSELEMALRLIFFSTHPTEFKWWTEGNEWYRKSQNYPDVWGRSYHYFEYLDNIKEFEELCDEDKKLFGGSGIDIKKIHKILSKSIHSGAGYFQTRPDRISPKYNISEFNNWHKIYEKVQSYINILLVLSFKDKFKDMTPVQKNKILDRGMDNYHKERVKQVIGL